MFRAGGSLLDGAAIGVELQLCSGVSKKQRRLDHACTVVAPIKKSSRGFRPLARRRHYLRHRRNAGEHFRDAAEASPCSACDYQQDDSASPW